MQTTLTYPVHVEGRMALRGYSYDEVEYIIARGVRVVGAGVCHYFLRRSDIRMHEHRTWSHLAGTVVLLSLDGSTVVTVYRAPDGLKGIRRKCQEFHWGRAA